MEQPSTAKPAQPRPAAASPKEVDSEWRRWVAENVLLNKEPNSIVAAMVREGFDPAKAAMEVRTALTHPYIKAAKQQVQSGAKIEGAPDIDRGLKKRDWVLECYRRAARQATDYGTVPRVRIPSRQAFLDNFYAPNKPVVIEGAMDNWPAISNWTPANLKRRLGSRMVEVQANRTSDRNYERNSVKLRKMMPFGEFIDMVESAGCSNDWYITAKNSGTNSEALKDLWEDIILFPEYLRADDPANRGFFWFGPAGTITPLHHDLTNNFMAQVRGSKLCRLISPCELPRLYNDVHCYSQVDLDNPDLARFPLFRDVQIIDVVIAPGDLLFLPVGWWHYVRSLDISITMSFTNFVFDNDFYSFYTTF
jgi:hypothetical protein